MRLPYVAVRGPLWVCSGFFGGRTLNPVYSSSKALLGPLRGPDGFESLESGEDARNRNVYGLIPIGILGWRSLSSEAFSRP
jgi:hypothetical protein